MHIMAIMVGFDPPHWRWLTPGTVKIPRVKALPESAPQPMGSGSIGVQMENLGTLSSGSQNITLQGTNISAW